MAAGSQSSTRRLSLIQRLLLLLLWSGVLLLLLEIRFEHQAMLGETWQAWIPLGYLTLLAFVIPIGLITIDRIGSKLLAIAFVGLIIVGSLGFWFHAKGKLSQRLRAILTTVQSQPGQLLTNGDVDDTTAPLLAPLSLVGLGTMGLLISILRTGESRSAAPFSEQSNKDDL